MPRIRLSDKVYHNFNSMLGPVKFKNGVSEHEVSENIVRRLAAIYRIEIIDEDGESQGQAGPAADLVKARSEPIAPLKAHPPSGEHKSPEMPGPFELKQEKPPAKEDEIEKLKSEIDEGIQDFNAAIDAVSEEASEPVQTYTLDDLEKIADEGGIAGLRAVAPEGVKSNRIEDLINKILEAQKG